MTYGVRLHVWGDYACFTRPEMKVERVSYDVMTPSAARGILEAIHWRPAIQWVVDRIHVLKPIQFETLRRNELGKKIPERSVAQAMNRGTNERTNPPQTSKQDTADELHIIIEKERQQRASTVLRDVAYLIEAHFKLTKQANPDDTEAKHQSMFNRRAAKGQCYHRPYLGTREFVADFALPTDSLPKSSLPPEQRDQDLGWILHDIDFKNNRTPRFFRARLRDGVICVPPFDGQEVMS